MQKDLKAAYTLISDFKRGVLPAGSPISTTDDRLIRMLSKDLDVPDEGIEIEKLVQLVAKADSKWNKRTMATIDCYYTLRDSGKAIEAERERTAFIRECPSVWYCGIVSAL